MTTAGNFIIVGMMFSLTKRFLLQRRDHQILTQIRKFYIIVLDNLMYASVYGTSVTISPVQVRMLKE